jgi:hypothetical protein
MNPSHQAQLSMLRVALSSSVPHSAEDPGPLINEGYTFVRHTFFRIVLLRRHYRRGSKPRRCWVSVVGSGRRSGSAE